MLFYLLVFSSAQFHGEAPKCPMHTSRTPTSSASSLRTTMGRCSACSTQVHRRSAQDEARPRRAAASPRCVLPVSAWRSVTTTYGRRLRFPLDHVFVTNNKPNCNGLVLTASADVRTELCSISWGKTGHHPSHLKLWT